MSSDDSRDKEREAAYAGIVIGFIIAALFSLSGYLLQGALGIVPAGLALFVGGGLVGIRAIYPILHRKALAEAALSSRFAEEAAYNRVIELLRQQPVDVVVEDLRLRLAARPIRFDPSSPRV